MGEEILPSNQSQIIQQAKFTYSPLEKPLEKQSKKIEDKGEKQVNAIEKHGKQLAESNALISKNILISTKMAHHLQKKEKYLINFLMKGFLKLMIKKNKINLNNLI